MSASFEYLKSFFEQVKRLGFWQRLFGWRAVKTLSYDAYEEFSKIEELIQALNLEIDEQKERIRVIEGDRELKQSKLDDYSQNVRKLEDRIIRLEEDLGRVNREKEAFSTRVAKFEEAEVTRQKQYQNNVSAVNTIKEGLENDRRKLQEERLREKEAHFEQMRQTWRDHEALVESTIKTICNKHTIEYVNEVPFRGKPDNTIMIAEEYIIFDAKSPASDNLTNFPLYLKAQTEQLSKYVKQEGVKRDLFLVIPSNTVNVINQFTYNIGDYTVYLLTVDALEPVILSLQKIEDYEFADKLSPEERDNICRVIGKFAHTAKRRIQIDYFFSYQFLEILGKVKSDLPNDFYDIVAEFEKAEKLNPPQEKRAKQILTDELIAESEKLAIEAEARLKTHDTENPQKNPKPGFER